MIARVYGRWIPEAAPDAGQKAVRIFAENAGKLMPALKTRLIKIKDLVAERAGFEPALGY
jgi:hypothetical protein